MEKEVVAALIEAAGTFLGALIVGVAGGLITRQMTRERDRQDRESQWRQHAIELTKLDLERKLRAHQPGVHQPLRPLILDFLANYRDLMELGPKLTPGELYLRIEQKRTQVLNPMPAAPAMPVPAPPATALPTGDAKPMPPNEDDRGADPASGRSREGQ